MAEQVTRICLERTPEGIKVFCTVESVLGVGTEYRETVYGDPEELLEWLREWMQAMGLGVSPEPGE